MDLQLKRWHAIAARIEGFLRGVELWIRYSGGAATGNQDKAMYRQAKELVIDLDHFTRLIADNFPPAALVALGNQRLRDVVAAETGGVLSKSLAAEAALHLSGIVSAVNYQLADADEMIRRLTERGFLHLQWSIASDEQIAAKWQAAFKVGEPACERLGATHLLAHGIFSFKASSGAITDLVLGEPVSVNEASVADGLVLTEWKRAFSETEAIRKIGSAEKQADLYAGGVLAGAELRSTRYIVIVSEKHLRLPPDAHRDGYLYRHTNIVVRPLSPSKAAPKLVSLRK